MTKEMFSIGQSSVGQLVAMVNKPNGRAGDYRQDGILHCGKCHTPKQVRGEQIRESLRGLLLSVPCDCENQRIDLEQRNAERDKVEELRQRCLPRSKMWQCTFANAENAPHIEVAQTYADNWERCREDGTGLRFWGTVGTGKSYAALCIANALIDKGIPVRYTSSADMLAEFGAKGIDQGEYIRKLCEVPLLLIDDLGAEHGSDYAQSQLCRLIDARKDSGKPMIITTNYTLDEMTSPTHPIKARIFERLSDCLPVQVIGSSRRKAEAEKKLQDFRSLLQSR